MKTRSLLLLIIFLGSLVPLSSVSAENSLQRNMDDSAALLYASRAILLYDDDLSAISSAPDMMAPADPSTRADARDTALANLIQATKDQRNTLDASCSQLKNIYAASGKTCERQVLVSYCDTQRDKLNTRLGYLHTLRGDKRNALTRLWHSVKRSSENIWHAVGPLGRRLLRQVGPEVAEVVLSGGTLSGGVLRKIVYKEARNVGRGELERLLSRGVEQFLVSQAALAQAAGVSDCTPEKLQEAENQVNNDLSGGQSPEAGNNGNDPESENKEAPISFTGQISLTCDQWVGDAGDSEGMGKLPLDVNFDSGDFYGEGSYSYVKDNGKTSTSTWVYKGSVSQEGILIGTMNMTTTVDNVDVGFVGGSLAAVGIITEDGRGLYLYTYQESNTEMLQLFKDGRDAVLNDRAQFMNSPEYPPTCR